MKQLDFYTVRYPSEDELNATVNELRQYVPEKKKSTTDLFHKAYPLIKHTVMEVTVMNKLYWIMTSLVYIFSYFLTVMTMIDPMVVLLFIAPLPFVFGLLEVFKGREIGLLEMEMACKYKMSEIILSRILLITIYNVILNVLLLFTFYSLLNQAIFWKISLILFTSFFAFNVVALGITLRFKRQIALIINLFIWIGYLFTIVTNVTIIERLMNTTTLVYGLLMVASIIAIGFQLYRISKSYRTYEGVEKIEVSHR